MTESYIEALLPPRTPRWNSSSDLGTPVTVTYSFMTRVPTYYPSNAEERSNFVRFNSDQMAAAQRALDLYKEVANITFTEVPEIYIPLPFLPPINLLGGQIRFGTASLGEEEAGHASYPATAKGGDVWLNNTKASNLTQTNGSGGFQTMLHEIGHALGLKHPGEYDLDEDGNIDDPGPYLPDQEDSYQYTLMSYNGNHGGTQYTGSSAFPETPLLYDIAAIQHLYGANTNTRTGDDTYSFDPTRPFVKAIWDADGTDTISAEFQVFPADIDLRAGSFSSIGFRGGNDPMARATNNLAIAYGVSIENAIGSSSYADRIVGNEAGNFLWGRGGNDTLNGFKGNDSLYGEQGNDQLVDFWGTNQLYGGLDDDTYFIGLDSDNTIHESADEGKDTVKVLNTSYRLGDNLENLELLGVGFRGWGNDLGNIITGTSGANSLLGEGGDDTLKGGGGNDELDGGTGNDTLDGGEDFDATDYRYATGAVTVDLSGSLSSGIVSGAAGTDTLVSIEYIRGSQFDDIFVGGNGDDIFWSRRGNDTLDGGLRSDTLYGGDGDDTLDGGPGSDTLDGGEDYDTADYSNALSGVTVDLVKGTASGGAGDDDLVHIERIIGSDFADTLIGGVGYNALTGGRGNDSLTGGSELDRFVYDTGAAFRTADVGIDVITDFIHDIDKIVLDKTTFMTISSSTGTGFSNAREFDVVSSGAAKSSADIVYNSMNGYLFYNENGSVAGFGSGGQFAVLTGAPVLSAADFLIQA